MKQVVQSVRNGTLQVVDVPRPVIGPTQVLVATTRSLLSAGTEKAVRQLAGASLLGKAKARPDLVRQVVQRARAEGIGPTMRAVRNRLDEDMPLGYSAAGIAVEVGDAVEGVRPGQRVATGSAGHAEFQVVPGHLAVAVPDAVTDPEAAFATVAAIALHGLRLADLGPGSRVCVVGLGLLGQLTVRLALAAGYEVAGIDVRDWTAATASESGALGLVEQGDDTTAAILDWTRGRGADAVLLTAATKSSDPVLRAPERCRDRAPVVVVGDVGLNLARTPFYEKELSLRFARSYGPGRYDRTYEDWGVDYPIGHVRWTEGRNLEAVLDLMAGSKLAVRDLVTHEFPIEKAGDAYALIESGKERFLGVQLTYETEPSAERVVTVSPRRAGGQGVGLLGAGTFARTTLVPALKDAGFDRLAFVASNSGLSARHLADRQGFERATTDVDAVLSSDDVDIVVVATPHDTHAELVVRALDAGKHVFCEKPLALTVDELDAVEAAWQRNPGQLMVGFNRRWSDSVKRVQAHFGTGGPLVLTYRVNAGALPASHWYHDRRQGGRLLGEVCHFIDTCNAIVGAPVLRVFAAGSGDGAPTTDGDVAVMLQYHDGSLATISYGRNGHSSTAKERLEVLGRGHSAVIDDYRNLELDGRPVKEFVAGKGHREELTALRHAVRTGDRAAAATDASLASMRATLDAALALSGQGQGHDEGTDLVG
jgi:predicted dehydrogenase/threonine dehydrogenase-like Zn-dependent dehydrogenase